MVLEGALPAARVGLCGTAPAAAPPLPEFFDKRAADTKALGNRPLRFCSGFQHCDDPVTQVLRVGFHTQDYTGNGPHKQLQPALVHKLQAFGHAPSHVLVVMEATGSYWMSLATRLVYEGFQVSVINPSQAHHFAKALLKRAKTDAINAQTLAQLASILQPDPWMPPP